MNRRLSMAFALLFNISAEAAAAAAAATTTVDSAGMVRVRANTYNCYFYDTQNRQCHFQRCCHHGGDQRCYMLYRRTERASQRATD